MSRSCGLSAVSVTVLLVLVLAAKATRPTDAEPQDAGILAVPDLHKEEATGAAVAGWMEAEPLSTIWVAEKKDGRSDAVTMESSKPSGGVAIQGGGDLGAVPSSGGGNASSGSESGEHGKEGSSKEGEKSASRSCLSKEECHKKRLLCGKGCTLSAHTKCAAKCSKSCVPTC